MTATDAVTGQRRPGPRPRRLLRRLLVWLTVLAVLAVAVFLGGGGWYFAGQINADALQVRHVDGEFELRVVSAGSGQVVLSSRDREALDLLTAGSTYGLLWQDGYGQLTGPAQRRPGGAVVRDLTVLDGDRPAAGSAARLDRDAFPDDPRLALGADTPDESDTPQVREVRIPSVGGTFPAWLAEQRDAADGAGRTWAVLVHGKGGTRAEMYRMMRTTVAAGLPSLDVTYRNDQGLRRDGTGRYRFGRTEWRELAAAVHYATSHGATDVVLVGASMGGAIVASYLERTPDAPVVGAVLDAPMLDFGATVDYGAARTPLPVLGNVPGPLTWTAKRTATLRYGVDWKAVDYLDDSSWLTVPALVWHGTDDGTVPLSTSRRLAEAHPDLVALEIVDGATHVGSWNTDPGRYADTLDDFLHRVSTPPS
ncbi:alpha/beta hydrolase family protein [Nocardioides mesophilus]|uniref:Alpha/beta hydrolase n=1 Tax=Nocardioides mesophilus TaxID=433659 RepID=A0A7G9RF54_9ACTN|nr:alpha/beta hydrolase [Nocardioides mesophilus]QNN54229.1 alpha/beta hydrolase [Nocardioides mesophilus]